MIEISLTLRLRSPLALHQTRAGSQYVGALDYIPGSALRGALAEAYLAQHGQPDDTFHALFLSEQIIFGDLWPAIEGKLTLLIPASAQACKRYGLSHSSSFRDALLDGLQPQPDNRKCKDIVCKQGQDKECQESLDRISGYLAGLTTTKVAFRSRLRVSTAIERATGAIAREMLFTQHTLIGKQRKDDELDKGKRQKEDEKDKDQEVYFQGTLRFVNPELKSELDKLLKDSDKRLFLGSGRSRGLGETEVAIGQSKLPGVSLKQRWDAFNKVAHQIGGDSGNHYFSLTLLSHLALRDSLLCPVLNNISPQEHLGLPKGVKLATYPDSGQRICFLSPVTVPGWNAALGLPKPDTVALRRGSVLLFQCQANLEQAVQQRLTQLETEGLGERRVEGFGRIAVCYPIHYERWEAQP